MNALRTSLALCALVCAPVQARSILPPPDISYTQLHKAASECDLEKVRAAAGELPAADKSEEINRFDREGYTPLAYAAKSGCIEVVKLLLENGASLDAAAEYWRWTPLLRAANQWHAQVVRYLLAHGANANAKARSGQTPLTAAILGSVFHHGPDSDRDETVQALLSSGADVNLSGEFNWTPLMTAVFRGDANLVRLLLGKGADVSAKDDNGKSALDYARERNEQEITNILAGKHAAAQGKINND
ncbi:MAG: ankyrin repeat domain-containing protein [Burkholderiales bacterium]